MPLRVSCSPKTAENSEKQRAFSLLFWSLNRRRSSISAEDGISAADNFLQKQRKQQIGIAATAPVRSGAAQIDLPVA
jgi:hypothetical protein